MIAITETLRGISDILKNHLSMISFLSSVFYSQFNLQTISQILRHIGFRDDREIFLNRV